MPTDSAATLYSTDYQAMGALLAHLLTHPQLMPADWHPEATTYDLPRHYSESLFVDQVLTVAHNGFKKGFAADESLTRQLFDCGLPYDYARLGQPLSSLYEWCLQNLSQAPKVVSFASCTKPFLSIIEARESTEIPVVLVCDEALPISHRYKQALNDQNVRIFEQYPHDTPPELENLPETALKIWVRCQPPRMAALQAHTNLLWDAICYPLEGGGLAFLQNGNIDPKAIQVQRKRTVSALLPGDCETALRHLLNVPEPPRATQPQAIAQLERACGEQLHTLFSHGVGHPLFFCTGLAAEAAIFQAAARCLNAHHPVPFYYAQNGYGGTGQLIGEILTRQSGIEPRPLAVIDTHTPDNALTLVDRFVTALETLHQPALIFLETPTNPQLQMHDFEHLVTALKAYQQRTGVTIPVLVDTTLAPLYPLFAQDFALDWPFLVVKSGSKYFTKGKATLGVVMANGHPLAQRILEETRHFGKDADAFARLRQLQALHAGLKDLPERMQAIAENTQALAQAMQAGLARRGKELTLYTMTPAQVKAGLATGVLSFYLPPAEIPNGGDLVDYFVDYLLTHAPAQVRNRVSYGQSGGAVYAGLAQDFIYVINPEESTQGALSQAVKDAQKKDNVQICRISVPAQCNIPAFVEVLEGFFSETYGTAP